MKKLFLILAVALILPQQINALNLADPFFMPERGQIVSDTDINYIKSGIKKYGIYEKLSVGVSEKIAIGASIGWADIKDYHSGMQDITFYGTYRFMDDMTDGRYLDLDAYFSPEMFDSPYNNEGGAAKGSSDFGLYGSIGSSQVWESFTIGATAGFEYIGSTDLTDSGTVWSVKGLAKYYIDDYNAVGVNLALKSYLGFHKDFNGLALGFNYSRTIIEDKMVLTPYFNIEKHTRDIASSAIWGINAKYSF